MMFDVIAAIAAIAMMLACGQIILLGTKGAGKNE